MQQQKSPPQGFIGDTHSRLSTTLRRLGSLKLALVILVALGAGVLVSYLSEIRTTWSLVVSLALLSVNLSAAVATNPAFRRQKALLIFHLALIAIILLIMAGRLTYLRGTLELANGIMFEGELTSSEAGPLHRWRLKDVKFVQGDFEIDYDKGTPNQGFGTDDDSNDALTPTANDGEQLAASAPLVSDARGARRGATRNTLYWLDDDGTWHTEVIGDGHFLELKGYQFFTSSNKGFAPLFSWTPVGGEPVIGAIYLPSYPVNEYTQHLEWTPPGSKLKLWTQLQFNEVIIDPYQLSQFRLPEKHNIVIRTDEKRYEMYPGDSVKLSGGELTYQRLTSWMGYSVTHDWTIIWLLAASIIAMLSLTWHFWQKFAARPWQASEEKV